MTFMMANGTQKVLDFDVVEGAYAYSSVDECYREWDEIPEPEQRQLVKLRDELQAVFMKVKDVGKDS